MDPLKPQRMYAHPTARIICAGRVGFFDTLIILVWRIVTFATLSGISVEEVGTYAYLYIGCVYNGSQSHI